MKLPSFKIKKENIVWQLVVYFVMWSVSLESGKTSFYFALFAYQNTFTWGEFPIICNLDLRSINMCILLFPTSLIFSLFTQSPDWYMQPKAYLYNLTDCESFVNIFLFNLTLFIVQSIWIVLTGLFHQQFKSSAEYVWGKVHNVQNVQKRTESYRKYRKYG